MDKNIDTTKILQEITTPTSGLTLEQYLVNPTGMPNPSVLNLASVRKALDLRYDKVIEEHPKFKLDVYKKGNDILFIHIRIPSETYDLSYDVVLELPNVKGTTIRDSTFKVYNNTPSFVYTYTYVYNLYNLLINDFKGLYKKEALTKEPIMKNNIKIISYEKSLYYAITYLLSHYETVDELSKKASKVSLLNNLKSKLKSDEEKLVEYHRKQKLHRAELKKEKAKLAHKDDTIKNKNQDGTINKRVDSTKHVIKGKSKIRGKSKIKGRTKH